MSVSQAWGTSTGHTGDACAPHPGRPEATGASDAATALSPRSRGLTDQLTSGRSAPRPPLPQHPPPPPPPPGRRPPRPATARAGGHGSVPSKPGLLLELPQWTLRGYFCG